MTSQRGPADVGRYSGRLRLLAVGVGLALLALGCAEEPSPSPSAASDDGTVKVASFDFSENVILAEIYSQSIQNAGVPTQLLSDLGTREVVGPALEQGQVDVVVDYLGSALEAADPGNPATHGSVKYARLELQKALTGVGVRVLDAAAAQDQNGFAVTQEAARGLSSPSVSALSSTASSMVFGGPPECADRPYCLVGLESVYR